MPDGARQPEEWGPKWTGLPAHEGVELGRFVLLDDVEGNGESWFLARAFRVLAARLPAVRAVLAFSDPVPRAAADGRVVLPGHVGTIYQAHNGVTGSPRLATLRHGGSRVEIMQPELLEEFGRSVDDLTSHMRSQLDQVRRQGAALGRGPANGRRAGDWGDVRRGRSGSSGPSQQTVVVGKWRFLRLRTKWFTGPTSSPAC